MFQNISVSNTVKEYLHLILLLYEMEKKKACFNTLVVLLLFLFVCLFY